MTTEEIMSATALKNWKLFLDRFNQRLALLSNEQLQQQVAPGRNRLLYLIGHLTATHDWMFPLLGLGERLFPELNDVYITSPDKANPDPLSPADLKAAWHEVNEKLTAAFEKLTPDEWLQKITTVSDEDFAKDPTRNKLAVFLSRTSHLAYHSGQAVFVK